MQRDLHTIHSLAHGIHCSRPGGANSRLWGPGSVKESSEPDGRAASQVCSEMQTASATQRGSTPQPQLSIPRQECGALLPDLPGSHEKPEILRSPFFFGVKSPDFSILADNSNYFKYHRPNKTCLWARCSLPVCSCCSRS